MTTATLNEFKTWAKNNNRLAHAVCLAQAFAETEKERVNAYILPILHRYQFRVELDGMQLPDAGRLITTTEDMYLTNDPRCDAYYAECDAAHRANGFKGPDGNCPALMAKTLHVKAENALLEAAKEITGVEPYRLYGANREKMLKLLIGACMMKGAK